MIVNKYLMEEMGINLTKEAIVVLKKQIRETEEVIKQLEGKDNSSKRLDLLNEVLNLTKRDVFIYQNSISERMKKISDKSVFDLSIIDSLRYIIENYYNLEYRLVTMEVFDARGIGKYLFVLVSELVREIPNYEDKLFWDNVENKNIIILGTTYRNCKNLEEITKISFDKNNSKKDTLKFNKGCFNNLDCELTDILNDFIDELILYKIESRRDELTKEDIDKVYDMVKMGSKEKRLVCSW